MNGGTKTRWPWPRAGDAASRPWARPGRLLASGLILAAAVLPPAFAAPHKPARPEAVVVVGTSPLPGTGIDPNKLPLTIQTITAGTIGRLGTADAATALNARFADVNINDNLDDPFQPDLLYRGFEASPVLGTPAGLAVYQDGVRINEAFGDTLNWDLVPDFAIARMDVVSANPVYGLNALGGAVIVTMKNGFSAPGATAELAAGSYGRRQATLQYAHHDGRFGLYVGARALNDRGWRQNAPDKVRQLFSDLSYRGHRLGLDLSYSAADNSLAGESATPVQELAISRALIFTSPQLNVNRLEFLTLNATYAATNNLSLGATVYDRVFHQSVVNGNTTNYVACTAANVLGYLCQNDGMTPIHDQAGRLVPDLSAGGSHPLGELDFESIRSRSTGASLQLSDTARVFGHGNNFTLGGSIDHDVTRYGAQAEVGTINPALVVARSGYFVTTPEGTPFTATPVAVQAGNTYYGLYLTDTLDLTPALALTASGRFNEAHIRLADQLGSALSGASRFSRFNPAIGMSYAVTPSVDVYAGYSEGSRIPTPAEIECSNPSAPCLLPSSLSSDPPNLRQVVSHTYEAGLRGQVLPLNTGRLDWTLSLFRTDVTHDIYAVATSLSTGYFQNIGGTRRQGLDLGLNYRWRSWEVSFGYSYLAATFQSSFLLPSPLNPGANAEGDIQIRKGDALPGIPTNRIKLAIFWRVTPRWQVGATALYEGDQYFRGDEANLMKPLAGFAVLNLDTSYRLSHAVSVFLNLDNVTDARYATFGVLGDPTGVGAPGVPGSAGVPAQAIDYRFESPAAPFHALFGVRIQV